MSACCSGLLEDFSAPRRSGSTFATECKHPKRAFLRRLFSLLNYAEKMDHLHKPVSPNKQKQKNAAISEHKHIPCSPVQTRVRFKKFFCRKMASDNKGIIFTKIAILYFSKWTQIITFTLVMNWIEVV